MELKDIKDVFYKIAVRFLEGLDLEWILTDEDEKYIGNGISDEKYELEELELIVVYNY